MSEPDDNFLLSDIESTRANDPSGVIAPRLSDSVLATLQVTAQSARGYAENAQAANTKRAYAADMRHYDAWCAARTLTSMPAEPATLALYFASLADAGAKFATIRRRIAAINGAHRDRGFDSPSGHGEVRRIIAGIARTIGMAKTQKDALGLDLLRQALDTFDSSLRGTRDRAILLLGFAGAFRRSELVALDVSDLAFSRKGLLVTLRHSKTDQVGEGRKVAVPVAPAPSARLCAVRAVKGWLQVARIDDGPLFRGTDGGVVEARRISDASIARLVKRATKAAGIVGDFSGHSLRAGFVTSAAEKRVPNRNIARVTGHRSAVLEDYVRRANVFDDPALLDILR